MDALVDRGATLLEANPALARVTGAREAAAIGHRRVLPALTVRPGSWVPPAREALGPLTVALTAIDALLAVGPRRALVGPGDTFAPWELAPPLRVCVPGRLAVIGRAYADSLRAWPDAVERLRLRRPSAAGAAGADRLEQRLLDVLWHVALRWGRPAGAGVALPRFLDLRALSALLGEDDAALAPALATLYERGTVVRRDGRPSALTGASPGSRRDVLRVRAARQLARARSAQEDSAALYAQLDLQLRRRDQGRR